MELATRGYVEEQMDIIKEHQMDLLASLIGMHTLCWNNFGNNTIQKESGIMLE